MKLKLITAATVSLLTCAAFGAPAAQAALMAPEGPSAPTVTGGACVYPDSTTTNPHVQPYIHCYSPAQIRSAYGVDGLVERGEGQTIVLVDAYGSPTGAQDLQHFHDTFYPSLPDPDYTAVYPNGQPDFSKGSGSGQSGPNGASGWAGEANLDIEWAYAIAPMAHIVLIGVPPAETEGVQGFPNLFKAISNQIDANPSGTVFSMSFGVTEETFGGAAASQVARFDAVFAKGVAKGDTFFASSGDDGTLGASKQHKDTRFYDHPTTGWPASSPYVTAVGGTQLQDGWTWDPSSDVAFTADGNYNPDYFNWQPGGSRNVVWNESWLPAATGGGPSTIYPRPAWQSGVLTGQGNHRLVPDVAWNAAVNGGVLVYTSFFPDVNRVGWHVYGGTSAASPQVAALTALATQRAGHGLGNINATLYGAGGTGLTDVTPVHEGAPGVISGDLVDNGMFDYPGDGLAVTKDPVHGWPTTTGYDMTTGWGTPQAPAFVTLLAGH